MARRENGFGDLCTMIGHGDGFLFRFFFFLFERGRGRVLVATRCNGANEFLDLDAGAMGVRS